MRSTQVAGWIQMDLHILDPASAFFLVYILIILPGLVWRGLQKTNSGSSSINHQSQSWKSLWVWTMVQHGILLVLAWLAGRGLDYQLFSLPALNAVNGLYALGALSACLVLSFAARWIGPENNDHQKSPIETLIVGKPRQRTLKVLTAFAASIAEEAAYRGVGFVIIWKILGNPWPAAFICAIAFALVHWVQGWKNVIGIFAIALVLQGLVVLTSTLILAMAVYVLFDLVAFYKTIEQRPEPINITEKGI